MSDLFVGAIRTAVPGLVGWVLGWLASKGLGLDPEAQTQLVAILTTLAIGAYYLLAAGLQKRWKWFGVLLGSTKQPTFEKKAAVPPAE